MSKVRIQKLIAQAGICSRRKAEELILAGRVKLNKKVVTELGTTADPETDKIQVNNETIEFQKKVYLLLNKPPQMITSHSDEAGRPVVYSLVKEKRRLFTAGRLDYNTEGVLLMTNDGTLVHKLTHPSSMVTKEYEVKVKGALSKEQLTVIENGVMLDDGPAQPVPVEKIRSTEKNIWYSFILTEGRNREVRRIVEAVGGTVLKLRRTSFAGLRADNIALGDVRPLTAAEILMLYEAAGLIDKDLTRDGLRRKIKADKSDKVPTDETKKPAPKKSTGRRAGIRKSRMNRFKPKPPGDKKTSDKKREEKSVHKKADDKKPKSKKTTKRSYKDERPSSPKDDRKANRKTGRKNSSPTKGKGKGHSRRGSGRSK